MMDKGYGFPTNRHEGVHPLKYYRTVRKFMARQYDLTESELEVLICLDDEYFTKKRFKEACLTTHWDRKRFEKLLDGGWIEKWRDNGFRTAALYKPTGISHRVVKRIYKILAGEEDLPTSSRRNDLERKKTESLSYTEKILRDAVRVMNDRRNTDKFR